MVQSKRTFNIGKWLLAVLFLAGMAGPLFLLFGRALTDLIINRQFPLYHISGGLLIKSILIQAAAAFLCCGLAVFAALAVWAWNERHYKPAFLLILLSAMIPPFIHVHAWIKAMDALFAFLNSAWGTSLNFTGTGAVIWTTAFSYLPYAVSFCLSGLFSIPSEITDVIRTEIRPGVLFRKIAAPHFIPYLFLGGFFIFLVNMNDYAIPSVFGVNVFALELFALFSASGDLYAISLSSVPLILMSLLLLLTFGRVLKKYELTLEPVMNHNPFRDEPVMKGAAYIGNIVLFLFLAVPAGAMLIESFYTKGLFQILLDSRSEITYSLLVSTCTAAFSVVSSALLSYFWYREKSSGRLVHALALPFLIPSAIVGLSLIAFWNNPVLYGVYQSPVMPVIGLAVRFSILSVLFMFVRMSKIEPDLIHAMSLSYSRTGGFVRVILPMIKKEILTCFLLVFALAMGEYGIVLLVTPPGYQMLTIKIYNYLHYGATEIVYALNLFVFLLVVLIGAVIYRLYRKPEVKGWA